VATYGSLKVESSDLPYWDCLNAEAIVDAEIKEYCLDLSDQY
jgi:hypothetical protein